MYNMLTVERSWYCSQCGQYIPNGTIHTCMRSGSNYSSCLNCPWVNNCKQAEKPACFEEKDGSGK